ncbi:MAG: NgoFVII family restriction endonuclease [Bacteroidetes bacterium]|nr:MAG: NgoFVII family restriction endonuclease [Bacteroidota bacterium]TAG88702.1 MAG: NgoFVII family restriction endonuclease [Bacteroidota bacterium]
MPIVYDNIDNFLINGLTNALKISKKADFSVGYFNLRGWDKIADYIDGWSGEDENTCRLLVGMQKPPQDILKTYFSLKPEEAVDNATALMIKKQLADDFRKQLTIGLPNEKDEIGLRKLSQQLKNKKVIVKLFTKYPLHAKLYLLHRTVVDTFNPIICFLGSSNLTLSGVEGQGELNIDVSDKDATEKLSNWFDERWEDDKTIDITKELIDIIDNQSWIKDTLPYHIYLKIAYHLSKDARAGINEFSIPKNFQNDLLDFQSQAVLVAANLLHKRNGVLVGDVVGLGKTMIASALMRILQEDFFYKSLIICPPNLQTMWNGYKQKYDLQADILPISKVQNQLPEMKRYKVVVIDESHNLRNKLGKRYGIIKEYIEQNDSMVILLSATPYNKTFLDLSNQLRLFIPEDKDLGVSPELYIDSIGGKIEFARKHQHHIRTLAAFEQSEFADDWRELMRMFMVRRTRAFIKEHYAMYDADKKRKYLQFKNGSRSYFPDRIPRKIEYHFDQNDKTDQYAKLYSDVVVQNIGSLKLARYGLGTYIDDKSKEKPTKKEEIIIENLSRAGKRLIGFCRTNLFKRLESSGYAFLLSLNRLVLRNYVFAYAIENKLPLPIGQQEANLLDEFVEDTDFEQKDSDNDIEFKFLALKEDDYKKIAKNVYDSLEKNKFQWINSKLFHKSLLQNLSMDCKTVLQILELGKDWKAKNDRQLNALENLITQTHAKEKVLVFTQFADTAYYLTKELKNRNIQKIEFVTGNSDDPTELAHRFSPVSNEKKQIKDTEQELRVIISTDVLSEGQNLQDAHVIVNYDLPWAIIRLIQRAGRIDRIGQQSTQIFCYSFFPEEGIEKIITLRSRLTQRLNENGEVVGSDEIFFDDQATADIKNIYNEKSGILDEAQDDDIDLTSYAYQIWKTATDLDPKLKKTIPELPLQSYSTKKLETNNLHNLKNNPNTFNNSVIVYTKTSQDNDILTWINEKGETITQSQKIILDAAATSPEVMPITKIKNHHETTKKAVEMVFDYQQNVGGTLGKKNSAKYKTYVRLKEYFEKYQKSLFIDIQLKKAIDQLFKYTLKEYARDTLNRQLKLGINDENLINLVISLYETDRLCIIDDDNTTNSEPQIICSLGIIK